MKKLFATTLFCLVASAINLGTVSAQWAPQTNPISTIGSTVGKVQFVSATEGWINTDGGSLLHTTNGGSTWNIVTPFASDVVFTMSDPAFNMQFVNSSTGWVMKTYGSDYSSAAGAVVYYTTDGGTSWSKSLVSGNSGDVGAQLQFIDASNGWATTYNTSTYQGKLYKTTNGGVTWTYVGTMPETDENTQFYFISTTTGWMLKINDNLGNVPEFSISKTTDGGATWTSQYMDNTSHGVYTQEGCGAIQFIDANNGWAVGPQGRIFKTTDGTNWTSISTSFTQKQNVYCKSLFIYDVNHVWIGGDPADQTTGSPKSHGIISTTDGGTTWTQESLALVTTPFSIFYWDLNHGWVTADCTFYNGSATSTGQIYAYTSGTSSLPSVATSNIRIATGNGTVTIFNLTTNDQIQVYSTTGQLIRSITPDNDLVAISNLSSGVYLLRIGSYSAKVVI